MAWDPIRDLLALHDLPAPGVGVHAGSAAPPVDLYETAEGYVLTAELPGIAREDVTLSVRDGRLTITGQRPRSLTAPEHYHRIERSYGAFSRTFAFEAAIDGDRITADLKDGVLTITLPKRTTGPRHVPIK